MGQSVKEVSAGGVVYSPAWGEPRILFIMDVYGRWALPKGHLEQGETPQQAALREIEEEVGLQGTIERELGKVHYEFSRDAETVDKTVVYFLIRATGTELRIAANEVLATEWVPVADALAFSDYGDNRAVLTKAVQLLTGQAML
ncbi:MAG: NUDIX hydrolase [Chloroflexi bacterium]|nr:NUDIX hydrolase [Chloroflexota bacterium]